MPSWAHKRTREGNKQIEGGRRWKSWTSLRPERPGTRPKTTTKQDKKTDREKPNKTETEQTKQGNPKAKRQKDRRAKHQLKRSNEGRTKGGESVKHRLTARKGENHQGGVWGGREQLPTNHTVPGKALTVLSQSTARKVRYLQVPGGRLDRC